MAELIRFSDAELEEMLLDIESERFKRKATWNGDAPDKGREAICAFANDLPNHQKAGVLFIGANNDGTPSNLPIDDRLLQTLADIKTDGQIIPLPTMTVEKHTLRGVPIAVVSVFPADAPPVRYRGRVWIRIGPRRGIATPQDERILSERRRYRDLPFDIQPIPSSELNDLNQRMFADEYLLQAVSLEVLAENQRSIEQQLASCRMIFDVESRIPTVLGILVLGKSPRDYLPGAYIQFLRIQGTVWSDPIIDRFEADGPIAQIIRRIDEKIDVHNVISVDIISESIEKQKSPYPRAAIQQITRNAIMHRTYEGTNSPIRVYWFNDRIEIHSPGGPFGIVTPENFGKPGYTDYRNPHLAEAMKVLGFVQRFGVGISIAQDQLRKNGNPPLEFKIESTSVLITMRVSL